MSCSSNSWSVSAGNPASRNKAICKGVSTVLPGAAVLPVSKPATRVGSMKLPLGFSGLLASALDSGTGPPKATWAFGP